MYGWVAKGCLQHVNGRAWRRLKTEVQDLAARSDRASYEKGEPFTDSQGNRQLEKVFEEATIVARAIDLYRKSKTS